MICKKCANCLEKSPKSKMIIVARISITKMCKCTFLESTPSPSVLQISPSPTCKSLYKPISIDNIKLISSYNVH